MSTKPGLKSEVWGLYTRGSLRYRACFQTRRQSPFDLFRLITQSVSPVTCGQSGKASRGTPTPPHQIRLLLAVCPPCSTPAPALFPRSGVPPCLLIPRVCSWALFHGQSRADKPLAMDLGKIKLRATLA